MEEDGGRLVVLTAPPFHGHMAPILQLATALHAKGFTIAIAHSHLNPPDPSNHSDFIFLPLSDNLSAIDASTSVTSLIQTMNTNCRPSFHQHLTRLMTERNRQDKSIVIIYDHIMYFAATVGIDLNLTSILFRFSSATYFPAFLARRQLNQQAQFLEQDFVMQDIVPGLHPLRYKDLPFSKSPIEVWHEVVTFFSQENNPSAVIWNTIKFLEHDALSQIHQHYQVPVFAVGPLHKITPSPPTSFLEEDTSCITWLDKQAPRSVIYVSFGSIMTLDANMLAKMAWGLAKSNQAFLWAVRPGSVGDSEWTEFFPEGFREETRERGLIVKWAPQKEILANSAVGEFWSYVWKIGMELEVLERGEMESMIRRIMVEEEGKEMRARAGEMKEMVKDALQNGGSSQDSSEGLVGLIMSSS